MRTVLSMGMTLLSLSVFTGLAAATEYSPEYFKSAERLAELKKNRPKEVTCDLVASDRLGRKHRLSSTSFAVKYADAQPEVEVKQTNGGEDWYARTTYLLADGEHTVEFTFDASVRDVTDIRNAEKRLLPPFEDLLVNEEVRFSFVSKLSGLHHSRDTQWFPHHNDDEGTAVWTLLRSSTESANDQSGWDVTGVLSVESLEDEVSMVEEQDVYEIDYGWQWKSDLASEDETTLFKPKHDDYMFVAKPANSDLDRPIEISKLNVSCTSNGKKVKI